MTKKWTKIWVNGFGEKIDLYRLSRSIWVLLWGLLLGRGWAYWTTHFFKSFFLGRLSHCHINLSQLGPWYLKKTTSNHPLPEYTPKLPILPTHARVIALPNGLKYSWTVCRSKRETVLDTHAFKNNIVASVRVLISFYHRYVGCAEYVMTFSCVLDRGNSAFASPVNFLG